MTSINEPRLESLMDADEAKDVFDNLWPEWSRNRATIETGQDARLQVIYCILTEVLGWPRQEISAEPHVESGFIDYLVEAGGKPKLVVEA